ncbi:hypothetical protein [Caldivirga sp.]|uniref:hypothetical protein n=1 Tax=Caldivirga sp. TaxID=2080243 RepID=UPI0025BFB929|nr:hypothetical protein [Caldivirga sp.]
MNILRVLVIVVLVMLDISMIVIAQNIGQVIAAMLIGSRPQTLLYDSQNGYI